LLQNLLQPEKVTAGARTPKASRTQTRLKKWGAQKKGE